MPQLLLFLAFLHSCEPQPTPSIVQALDSSDRTRPKRQSCPRGTRGETGKNRKQQAAAEARRRAVELQQCPAERDRIIVYKPEEEEGCSARSIVRVCPTPASNESKKRGKKGNATTPHPRMT